MSPFVIVLLIVAYFGLLMLISYFTSRGADNETFFLGNKKSPWFVVAFGMIGASLSGVTFISVPGWVGTSSFSYMQVVLGYIIGYFIIATVLMPVYYRMNLTSIYSYLDDRFGNRTYKTGASFFLLSRIIGASFRLYIVANVLQLTVFDKWHVPFAISVIITILLIWVYTFRGGIKTIVWTDTLQTLFMLIAVGLSVYYISSDMGLGLGGLIKTIKSSSYSQVFFWELNSKKNFFKEFFSGIFIAIVMTGLDQDMMQKNLSCKNIRDAQKNMFTFSIVQAFVVLVFLGLGALLYIFCTSKGIKLPALSDDLYPMLATQGFMSPVVAFFFIIGLIAAAYSSADSALAALTTSFCVDILDVSKKEKADGIRIRKWTHVAMSVVLVIVILIFKAVNDQSVISAVFTVAGYTYGPLLGLYAFGLITKLKVKDHLVPFVCILSPVICYILSMNSVRWFDGYKFGFELLILNGLLTFIGLWLIRVGNNGYVVDSKPTS